MIWAILLLGLLLRILNFNQSYWLDESIGVLAARDFSYSELVRHFVKFDFHPPFHYVLLKFWGENFGFSEISTRSLSVLFGVGTIYVVYKIAQNLDLKKNTKFWRNWPIIVALFLATSPLHIYYSQEVRMYPMVVFFACISVLFYIKSVSNPVFYNWLIFSSAIVLLVFTDYVPLFLLPIFIVESLLNKRPRAFIIKLFLSHIPLFLFSLLWAQTFLAQIQSGKALSISFSSWAKIVGSPSPKELVLVWIKFIIGRISFVNKVKYAALIIIYSIPFLTTLIIAWLRKRKDTLILWLWLILPLILGYISSFIIPSFSYFRYIFVLPAFYLLLSFGVSKSGRLSIFLGSLILIVNIVSYYFYLTNKGFWREDWRAAVSFVESNALQDEIVLFEFEEPFAPYKWYSSWKVTAKGGLKKIPAEENSTTNLIEDLIQNKGAVWYFIYLKDLTDPEGYLQKNILESGFGETEIFDFNGVGNVIYYKRSL